MMTEFLVEPSFLFRSNIRVGLEDETHSWAMPTTACSGSKFQAHAGPFASLAAVHVAQIAASQKSSPV